MPLYIHDEIEKLIIRVLVPELLHLCLFQDGLNTNSSQIKSKEKKKRN